MEKFPTKESPNAGMLNLSKEDKMRKEGGNTRIRSASSIC